MPRSARKESGCGIYHVMMRGVNRQAIFDDDEDCRRFMDILADLPFQHDDDGRLLPIRTCVIYAWCLMMNHFHLLVMEKDWKIAEVIKSLASSYVYYYNKKNERIGHLFQERLGLEKGKYILLSAHREENIDTEKNFMSLFTAINKMAEKYDMPILYSCHPRSRKRLEASGFKLDKRVIQHEPLGFHDYNCLQMNAFAVVSDSGTLPEESSFFTSVGHPFPAICIRTSTERPEALDKACFFIAGIDEVSLLQAVDTAVTMNQNGDYGIPVPDYVEENVSTKVVKIIQSYVGIVNKMVWRKF